MTHPLCPRTTSVNAWAVLVAPADRDHGDPVRADLGRPEHPAGPQAPEWHSLRSPPSCSTYRSTTLPCQIPPSAEQVPTGALGTVHRTVSVTRERVSLRRGVSPRGWPGTPDRHGATPRGCPWLRRARPAGASCSVRRASSVWVICGRNRCRWVSVTIEAPREALGWLVADARPASAGGICWLRCSWCGNAPNLGRI